MASIDKNGALHAGDGRYTNKTQADAGFDLVNNTCRHPNSAPSVPYGPSAELLSPADYAEAIADLSDFVDSDAVSLDDCIAVQHAVDAIEDGRAVGAEVLITRDEHGVVRAAMSLMTRTDDGPPHLLINSTGSTMPGSNRAMLRVAMQRAIDENLPLYLIPTDAARDYWVQHGAVRLPDSRDGFYEYSADAMRRALRDRY